MSRPYIDWISFSKSVIAMLATSVFAMIILCCMASSAYAQGAGGFEYWNSLKQAQVSDSQYPYGERNANAEITIIGEELGSDSGYVAGEIIIGVDMNMDIDDVVSMLKEEGLSPEFISILTCVEDGDRLSLLVHYSDDEDPKSVVLRLSNHPGVDHAGINGVEVGYDGTDDGLNSDNDGKFDKKEPTASKEESSAAQSKVKSSEKSPASKADELPKAADDAPIVPVALMLVAGAGLAFAGRRMMAR